jgi:hypothetical protein
MIYGDIKKALNATGGCKALAAQQQSYEEMLTGVL